MDHCRGQAYDGAPNMLGENSGVAVRIKTDYPKSIEARCLGHLLEFGSQKCEQCVYGHEKLHGHIVRNN